MNILILTLLVGVAVAAPSVPIGAKTAEAFMKLANSRGELQPAQEIETINEFFDVLLEELRLQLIRFGFEPLELPDLDQTISGVKLSLKNGMLQNITTIQRESDIIVDYEDRVMITDVPLKFDNFKLNYDYGLTAIGKDLKGNVTGIVQDLGMFISFEMDFKNLVMTLRDFQIAEIGKMDVKFQGGSIDWLMNLLTGAVTTFFKDTIAVLVGGTVKEVLTQVIEVVNKILAGIKQ